MHCNTPVGNIPSQTTPYSCRFLLYQIGKKLQHINADLLQKTPNPHLTFSCGFGALQRHGYVRDKFADYFKLACVALI